MPVKHKRPAWEFFLIGVGLLVVLMGAADVASRFATGVLGERAAFEAFAPLPALDTLSVAATSSDPLIPARLRIPSIGVNAVVEAVGKNPDGSMGTPKKFSDVAWYSLGAKPGEAGNAVFDGHVNNALTTSGVFEHLSQVKAGDDIAVSDAAGNTLTFTVTQTAVYPANEAPAASLFSREGPPQLILITCDGDWVQSNHSFDKRLVVFAKLRSS